MDTPSLLNYPTPLLTLFNHIVSLLCPTLSPPKEVFQMTKHNNLQSYTSKWQECGNFDFLVCMALRLRSLCTSYRLVSSSWYLDYSPHSMYGFHTTRSFSMCVVWSVCPFPLSFCHMEVLVMLFPPSIIQICPLHLGMAPLLFVQTHHSPLCLRTTPSIWTFPFLDCLSSLELYLGLSLLWQRLSREFV